MNNAKLYLLCRFLSCVKILGVSTSGKGDWINWMNYGMISLMKDFSMVTLGMLFINALCPALNQCSIS